MTIIVLVFLGTALFTKHIVLYALPYSGGNDLLEYKFITSVFTSLFSGQSETVVLFVITPVALLVFSVMSAVVTKLVLNKQTKYVITSLLAIFNFVLLSFISMIGVIYGFYIAKNDFAIKYYSAVEKFDVEPSKYGVLTNREEILKTIEDGVSADTNLVKYKLMSDENAQSIFFDQFSVIESDEYSMFAYEEFGDGLWEDVRPEVFLSDYIEYKDILYLNNVNKRTFDKVSLAIAKAFVTKTYPDIAVKSDPKVSIVTISELTVIKNERIKKSLEIIDKAITDIKSWIASWEQDLVLVQGYYKTYGTEYWLGEIRYDQEHIALLKSDLADWEASKVFFTEQLDKEPYEYGLFYYPDDIYLVLDENYNDDVLTFVPTVVHEYLHYITYDTNANYDDITGIEEGVTDYVTYLITLDNLEVAVDSGYPELVGIVKKMNEVIPGDALIKAYISGDKKKLVDLIKTTFGEDFYSSNIGLMNSLAYPMDEDQEAGNYDIVMQNLEDAISKK